MPSLRIAAPAGPLLFAVSALCQQPSAWVHRAERPIFGLQWFADGGLDGGPAIVRSPTVLGFDGGIWKERSTLPPGAIAVETMVLDRERGRVVAILHDGSGHGTFELEGATWTRRSSAILGSRLVYDPARRAVLALTANWSAGTTRDHVWNGSTWTPMAANLRPLDVYHAIAPDLARRRLVGIGHAGTPNSGQTWEWDGATWTQRTPANSPAPRLDPALGFDPRSRRVLLFGGNDGSGTTIFSDTWEWDGAAWTQRQPTTTPPTGANVVLAFDRVRAELVLFDQSGDRDHAWTGSDWSPCHQGPAARSGASLGIEPLRNVVVLHDGATTSEWDGRQWSHRAAGGPLGLQPMAYDISTDRMVLFAPVVEVVQGGVASLQLTADTWTWSGTAWTRLAPATGPSARTEHALVAWLPAGLVLFGGFDANATPLRDTWIWSNGTWTERTATLPVAPAAGHAAGANPPLPRDPLVVAGNQLWSWNGAWNLLDGNVPTVALPALGTDRDGAVVLTGRDLIGYASFALRNGTWTRGEGPPVLRVAMARDPLRGNLLAFDGGEMHVLTDAPLQETVDGVGCGSPAPTLTGEGLPRVGNADYRLGANVAAAAPVVFAMDFAPAALPLGGGCVQRLASPTVVGLSIANGSGVASRPVPIPFAPQLRGLVTHAQVAALQPAGPLNGIALSAGLRITVGE